MAVIEIKPGVFWVGSMDWDRRIFDELVGLPDGTSYNAYIVKGSEKIALIDSVDPSKEHELLENLSELGIEYINYIISNHAEQDHSGAIPAVLERYPEAEIVTNLKCKNMLMDHLHISDDKFLVVGDEDMISLGDRTLKFILTPWVHWPETMTTYIEEEKIAFTCDFFGSHLATSELITKEDPKVLRDAKRYYAEIMMPFRNNIKKNLEKIEEIKPDIIAPSHGPVYSKPSYIINAYREWISDNVKPMVIIPYVSMHDSTEIMVEYLVEKFMENNIQVKPYNLTVSDIGEIAMSLVDASTVIIGTPTVLATAHPSAIYAAYLIGVLKPKTKFISIVGSYGWGGKTVETLKSLIGNVKAEFIEPVLVKGLPQTEEFKLLDSLVEEIVSKNR